MTASTRTANGAPTILIRPGDRRTRSLRDGICTVETSVRALQLRAGRQPRHERHRGCVVDQRDRSEREHDEQQQREREDI